MLYCSKRIHLTKSSKESGCVDRPGSLNEEGQSSKLMLNICMAETLTGFIKVAFNIKNTHIIGVILYMPFNFILGCDLFYRMGYHGPCGGGWQQLQRRLGTY